MLKFALLLVIKLGFIFFAANAYSNESKPANLRVYATDSFVSEYGPGMELQKLFEAQCHCKLNFIAFDSENSLISRLQFEEGRSKADVILGFDNYSMPQIAATKLVVAHGLNLGNVNLQIKWDNKQFAPYDYGFLAFVVDKLKIHKIPTSFKELLTMPDAKIIIQDPRTSTSGLGLLLWVKLIYGDGALEVWKKLSHKIVTVTKGWGESYSLFVRGEANMVLSYTTSPLYHIIYENSDRYKEAVFEEGHIWKVELMAQLKSSANPKLAKQFMEFMLSRAAQKIIAEKNLMYPVALDEKNIRKEYNLLKKPDKILYMDPEKVFSQRHEWVREWTKALQ